VCNSLTVLLEVGLAGFVDHGAFGFEQLPLQFSVQNNLEYGILLYRKEGFMPTTWKLEQARAHFSELVERAQRGETQLVTKHGQPAVYIIAAHHLNSDPNGLAGKQTLWDVLKSAPRSEEDDLFERDLSIAREIDL
jgi:antitoxin Phd